MLIEWLVDLVMRPQSQAEWEAQISALQNANKGRIEQAGPATAGSLKVLEEQVRQNVRAGLHRPTRQAFREYERELAALAATGKLTPSLQADVDRSVAASRGVAAKIQQLLLNTAPVDRDKATAAIARLYAALELPGPPKVVFLEPGSKLDVAALPPPLAPDSQPSNQATPPKGRVTPQIIAQRLKELKPPSEPPGLKRIGALGNDPALDVPMKGLQQTWQRIIPVATSLLPQELRSRPRFVVGQAQEVSANALFAELRKAGIAVELPAATRDGMAALGDAFEMAGIVFGFDGFAVVVGRPTVLTRDPQSRLHNATGPALAFADGSKFHFWRGQRVGADVIEHTERITAEQIRAMQNDVGRTVLIERFGAERFIKEFAPTKVHEDETGVLWRAELSAPLRGKELLAKGNYAGLTEAERKAVEALPDNGTVIRTGVNVQAVEIAAKPGSTERELRVVPIGLATAREAVALATTGNATPPRPEIPK